MRVAIDGRRLQDRPLGGVGRHLANVVPRVAAEAEVVVLTDARRPPPDVPGLDAFVRPLRAPRRMHEAPWLHVAVPLWLRHWDGIFHGSFNQLPWWSPVPAVVTIHDLSFEHHPEDFGPAARRWFQIQARFAVRRARLVLTPTDAVRRDVATTYGIDGDRIRVVPNAVDGVFHPRRGAAAQAELRRLGVSAPYVVALGGARRRGLAVSVAAWRASGIAELGVGLVVVGPEASGPEASGLVVGPEAPRPGAPRPEASHRGGGVTWTGPLPDASWALVLAAAEALCYPTRYEGFGMPALEAAASGTPVVCTRLPALVEVLGDAAEWCVLPTVDAIAAGLRNVVSDPARGASLIAAGLARAAEAPGWDEVAAATVRAYREAVLG